MSWGNRLRSQWFWLAVAAVVAGVGGAWYWIQRAGAVSTPVRRGSVVEAVYGLGTVTSPRTFQLRVGVTVGLEDVYVKEGDVVKSGSPLVRLSGNVVQRSPLAGTVTAVGYRKGETVFPQVPILQVVDLTDLYVAVSLEQQGALRVKKGQVAKLSFESLRAQKLSGVVSAVFPVDGQFMVHIDVQGLPSEVLPGMTADVAIEVAKKDSALLVPVAAISSGRVTVVRGNKKQRVEVKLGTIDGQWAEVVSGDLQEGDQVVSGAK